MKTKILVALLAVTVVGSASAGSATTSRNTQGYASVSATGTEQTATYACLNSSSCNTVGSYTNTAGGLAVGLVCQNGSVYSAPSVVNVNYDEGKVNCVITSAQGAAVTQSGTAYQNGVGGVALFTCTTGGTAQTIKITGVTCPASGTVAGSTKVTNTGTLAGNPSSYTASS